MAATLVAGATSYYQEWDERNGAVPMLGGAVLLALIAYARQKGLERKKLAFCMAVDTYEKMLASADRHPR